MDILSLLVALIYAAGYLFIVTRPNCREEPKLLFCSIKLSSLLTTAPITGYLFYLKFIEKESGLLFFLGTAGFLAFSFVEFRKEFLLLLERKNNLYSLLLTFLFFFAESFFILKLFSSIE